MFYILFMNRIAIASHSSTIVHNTLC